MRRRRRGLRARRRRAAELLRDAAGEAGDADRVRGLRSARARREAGRRPAADRAPRAAGGAARPEQSHDPALGDVRRRRGAAHGRGGAEARGRDGEARVLELRRRPPFARLAEGQDDHRRRVRDLRLDGGTGSARRELRLAGARALPRRGARVGRQRRHGLQRAGHRRSPRAARAAAPEDVAARGRPEDAEGARGGRHLGPAGARLRGRVRGVDARRPPPRADVQAPPRRQDAARDGGVVRRPRGEAVQPGQAVLAGRGDHEGRPARVLRGGRAGAAAASPRPAVHDAALSRRRVRQGVLPEGRAVAHAGLDPDVSASRSRPAKDGRRGGSRRRS